MKILIVEDNAAMRRLIRTLLSGLAGALCECEDGLEALPAYLRHRPDWVLMDIKMPGLDGIEASRKILAADPKAKIVIVTDYDDERLRTAAQKAGARGYVLKERLLDLKPMLSGETEQRQ